MGSRLKQEIADYMDANPGVKYTKARQEVLARTTKKDEDMSFSRAIDIALTVLTGTSLVKPFKAEPVKTGEGILPGDILRDHDGALWVALGEGKVISDDGLRRKTVDEIGSRLSVRRLVRSGTAHNSSDPYASALVKHLYGLDGIPSHDKIIEKWTSNELTSSWNIPLGTLDGTDEVFTLNIAEGVVGGTGPHGVIIGDTTQQHAFLMDQFLMSLTLQYSPDKLQLALIENDDSGAGDTALGRRLEPWMLFRVKTIDPRINHYIREEIDRRSELLYAAGARDIREYSSKRVLNPDMEPIPMLLVVLDGAFMGRANSTLVKVTDRVASMGRSLGVYLLIVGSTSAPTEIPRHQLTYAVSQTSSAAMARAFEVHSPDYAVDSEHIVVGGMGVGSPVKVKLQPEMSYAAKLSLVSAVNAAHAKWVAARS